MLEDAGGKGKSLLTKFRRNVWESLHKDCDPSWFATDEEFRKSSNRILNASFTTAQEVKEGKPIKLDILKRVIAGESIASRPL